MALVNMIRLSFVYPHHGSGVTVASAGVSGALAGKIGGGFSWTDTTKPLNAGKFAGFTSLDYLGYLLRRLCN
jgi:hypothetical protein